MSRYRKIPVEINAIQFTRETATQCLNFCPKMFYLVTITDEKDKSTSVQFCNNPDEKAIPQNAEFVIQTLEGNMRVSEGDWIIRGVKGEFYPCKPDIFAITYEKVEEE